MPLLGLQDPPGNSGKGWAWRLRWLVPAAWTDALLTRPAQSQERGCRQASSRSASGDPSTGCWSYSQRAVKGKDIKMLRQQPRIRVDE